MINRILRLLDERRTARFRAQTQREANARLTAHRDARLAMQADPVFRKHSAASLKGWERRRGQA